MKKIIMIALICAMLLTVLSTGAFAAGKKPYTVAYGTANVNGEIGNGEWDAATKETCTNAVSNDCINKTSKEGASSVSFRTMWDENYLYLLFELEDDQLDINKNKSEAYLNDSIFLFISENKDSTTYGDETYQLCIFPYRNATDYDDFKDKNQEGKVGTFFTRNGNHDISKDKYVCKVTDVDGGIKAVMELSIKLNNFDFTAGKNLTLDFQYNDTNYADNPGIANPRESLPSWSAEDAKGPNDKRDQWGVLSFANKPQDPGTTTPGGDPGTTTPGGDPGTTEPPKTGDVSALVAVISIISLAAVATVVVKRRKN